MQQLAKIPVLVTGVGGGGVGEGIVKALRLCCNSYHIIATDLDGNAPLLFQVDKGYIIPPANNPDYVDTLRTVCKENGVIILIPGSESELRVLSHHREAFSEDGIILLINPPQVISVGDDKWATYLFLREHGLESPLSTLEEDDSEFWAKAAFPVVVKPRRGHASQNVFVVRDRQELLAILNYLRARDLSPLMQEYIGSPAEEYTVGVVSSREGEIMASIAMKRLLKGGFSQFVLVDEYPEARLFAETIAMKLGARGPLNIQCRRTDTGYSVLEINPRFSGTTPIRAAVGLNEVDILIRNFLYGEKPQTVQYRTRVVGMRLLHELYVDLHDYENTLVHGYTGPCGSFGSYISGK